MNSFSIILLFILFIQICYCQYIMTSYSKKKMYDHLLKLYKYIFIKYSFDYLYNSNFKDIITNDLQIYDIQVSNFNLTDQNYTPYYLIEKNVIVFSKNKVGITFKYKTNKKKDHYSFFYFNPKSIVLKENNISKTELYMDIDIDIKDCIYKSRDSYEILNVIKNNFLKENMDLLKSAFHNAMKKGINELYSKYESISFLMNDIFGSKKIFQFIELSEFSGSCDSLYNPNTVQCYYIGGGFEAYNNKDLNKTIVGSDFFNDNGKFKLFISEKLIKKFIEKIQFLSYNITFDNNKINFSDFFHDDFIKDDSIKNIIINYQYKNITFDYNSKIVSYIINFYIEKKNDKIILEIKFKGNFNPSYFVTNLNLVSKNITVDKINNISGKKDVIKSNELEKNINKYLNNKEFYFVDNNGIELFDFFKLIQNTSIVKGGIVIEGEGLLKSIKDIFE